jgi:hypothetical protein
MTLINIKRLHHIQLCIPTGKEAEAKQFYCEILGLQEIPKPEILIPNGGFWLQVGDIQVHIGVEDEINKSKRHPAFEVENSEGAKKHLEKFNISINEEKPIPGQKRFSFRIRSGIELSFWKKFDCSFCCIRIKLDFLILKYQASAKHDENHAHRKWYNYLYK